MLRTEKDLSQIVVYTHAGVQRGWTKRDVELPYSRIVGAWHNDSVFGEDARVAGQLDHTDERQLVVPHAIKTALFDAVNGSNNRVVQNCHSFSQSVHTGRPLKDCSLLPIRLDFPELPVVDRLGLGEIGVLGVSGYGIPHSLVGLGGDESEALQVMSSDGELGFAHIDETIRFYEELDFGGTVGLRLASA